MLIMIDGEIKLVSEWPDIGSKCQLNTDRPALGLRNRQALDMLHEALAYKRVEKGMVKRGFWAWLFGI